MPFPFDFLKNNGLRYRNESYIRYKRNSLHFYKNITLHKLPSVKYNNSIKLIQYSKCGRITSCYVSTQDSHDAFHIPKYQFYIKSDVLICFLDLENLWFDFSLTTLRCKITILRYFLWFGIMAANNRASRVCEEGQ